MYSETCTQASGTAINIIKSFMVIAGNVRPRWGQAYS